MYGFSSWDDRRLPLALEVAYGGAQLVHVYEGQW